MSFLIIDVSISTQLMVAEDLINKATVWDRWVLEGAGPRGKAEGVE